MFDINLKEVKCADDVNFDKLVQLTNGYSGADIASVCREAAMMGLRAFLRKARAEGLTAQQIEVKKDELDVPIEMRDFQEAITNTSKSVGNEDLKEFEVWMKEFGST
jgi:SpoVK/Ycf46/Vps4 family AAA+-type ATPase